MKKSLIYLMISLFLIFASGCDNEDDGPSDPTNGGSAEQYYPGNVGTTYNYEGTATDSSGTMPYTRDATYTSQQTQGSNTYIVQSNVITAGPETMTGEFLFRTSTNGLYIFIDASGLEDLLDSVDTGEIELTITADPEVRMLAYPFESNTNWDAFSINVSAYNGLVTIEILNLKGYHRGQETVNVMSQNMTAEKIEYIATIKIPESIEDITNPQTYTVSAFAWYVKDVGLVKLEGSSALANAFIGGDIELEGEEGTVSEVLVNYNIQ